jgi:hypothetical protein
MGNDGLKLISMGLCGSGVSGRMSEPPALGSSKTLGNDGGTSRIAGA